MHSLWILFVAVSLLEARKWYQVVDKHLEWPKNQEHCAQLVRNFNHSEPVKALECIKNHSKVRKVPRLRTAMTHCAQFIADFKPIQWSKMDEEVQYEIAHCIIDRILTHESEKDYTSEDGIPYDENVVVWRRKKEL